MSANENQYATELQIKFDYGFLALIFGSLALSVQFSPGMGKVWPWLLVASWFVLLLAGLIGGWISMYRPVILQRFVLTSRVDREIAKINRSEPGTIFMDYSTKSKIDSEAALKGHKKIVGVYEKEIEKLNNCFTFLGKSQRFLFVGAIIANMVFASVNYLCSGG